MKVLVFSIRDVKLGSFLQPFFSQNLATATRTIVHTLRDPQSHFRQFPDDFILFHLGEFDDELGSFTSSEPVNLGLLSSFISSSDN